MRDLLYLMQQLRHPVSGCPWDIKQSAKDIINHSIEEVYELADAIEQGDSEATRDELGDVLFQVIFLSRIAEEKGDYDFYEVVSGLVAKLVRRHPHVFPNGSLDRDAGVNSAISESEVKVNWETIKQQERSNKNRKGLFDDIPGALPALNRAIKLQKRAATAGYDWQDEQGPIQKVEEELCELKALLSASEAVQTRVSERRDTRALEGELGDLLFSVTNVCRKLGVSPEQALRASNRKFERRVTAACEHADYAAAKSIEQAAARLAALDTIWERVKAEEFVDKEELVDK